MKSLHGNYLRVEVAIRLNAGYIVCKGKTEHEQIFAARGQLKVIGTNRHFISIHNFLLHILLQLKECLGMYVSCHSVLNCINIMMHKVFIQYISYGMDL